MDPEKLSQYLGVPIEKPPPGVAPNFVNPESTASDVYITGAVCIPPMVGFSLIKLVAKLYLGPKAVRADEGEFA